MALQNLFEDKVADFSGLASSLLPPSGAFFSGWTPQQWQNVPQNSNAHDLPGAQQPSTSSYHSSSFQKDLPDSSVPYQPNGPNDYGASDHTLSSGEVSARASAATPDSAQGQIFQNTNNGGYGANLAASYGVCQSRPTSAAFPDNNSISSHNALSGTATPPGSLAELKLKAKESIRAKKASNVRSSSHDIAMQTNGTDSNIAIKGESLTRKDASKTEMETVESDSLDLRQGLGDTTKSTQVAPQPTSDAFKTSTQYPTANKNLVPPRDKNFAGVQASSIELEDLLTQGRAEAEKRSQVAPESTAFHSGSEDGTKALLPNSQIQSDQIGTKVNTASNVDQLASANKFPPQRHTDGEEHSKSNERNECPPQQKLGRKVPANSDPQDLPRDSNTPRETTNARKLQADRDINMSDAPNPEGSEHQIHQSQSNKPPGSQEEETIAQDTSAAGGQYNVDDVEEWLSLTGFHDEAYRQKVLNRRRRMKAIEEERLQLLLEEQADQDQRSQLVRSHSALAMHPAPVSPFVAGASSVLPMPAPRRGLPTNQDLGLKIKDSALKNENAVVEAKIDEMVGRIGLPKQRTNQSTVKDKEGQPQKIMRTELDDHKAEPPPHAADKMSAGSPLVRHYSPPAGTQRFVEERHPSDLRQGGDLSANHSLKRKYDQWIPDKPAMHADCRRNSHESRNARGLGSDRRANRSNLNIGHRHSDYHSSDQRPPRYAEEDRLRRDPIDETSPPKPSINLRVSNVRYFLIKSWNYENIETAQRECTWCTQTKNEDLFVNAFRESTHVILIFSANNSHAFQGYARMQGLPGEPGVPDPTWRKYLHWPTTKPFKIRWITKGDSSYRVAGNLRNPLNDDSLIFVGRDGQEIPDRIGLQLCEALDQDAKYRS